MKTAKAMGWLKGELQPPKQVYFSGLTAGIMTWPSLKTILSTDANVGSPSNASATLNEGSGSHFAPPLASESAASVIA
jgi:hypothetical protein